MSDGVDVFRDGDEASGVAEATGTGTAGEVSGYEECIWLESDIGTWLEARVVCCVEEIRNRVGYVVCECEKVCRIAGLGVGRGVGGDFGVWRCGDRVCGVGKACRGVLVWI